MALNFTIPMEQTIYADANGYGSVRIVKDSGVSEFVKCYTPDFTDVVKNKPYVVHWVNDGNNMPTVVPFPAQTLAEAKAEKINAIDAKTVQLIRVGFSFAGDNFSMSDAAQRNWIGLGTAKALSKVAYPLTISTVDESYHTLADADALNGFIDAYLNYQMNPSAPLNAGRVLKAAVEACETIAEVDAIVDDR